MEPKRLVKFFSLPAKKSIKDFITDLGRKLNFTRSSYRDINGLFVELLPNQRYHLFMYTRNVNVHQQLREAAKETSDPNYLSLEINKMNNLFILPPFSNAIYRVQALNPQHSLHEKVIEFSTGAANTIMDVINMIDCKRYKINYVVCNREKSFIAFRDGIDAIEVVDILRRINIPASFANCYAHLDVEGNNSCHPHVARRQLLPLQQNMDAVNPQVNDARNIIRNNRNNRSNRHNFIGNNRINRSNRHYSNNMRRGRGYQTAMPFRRRNYPQNVQQNPPHAIRVPLANTSQGDFEWILVRK